MAHPFERPSRRSLVIVLVLLVAGLAVPSLLAPNAAAAGTTYISGNACDLSTTPTWVNTTTYVMTDNVTVPVGCILTIEPGTAIRADPLVHLYLDGVLEANGTAANSISFDTNATNLPWGGVQFNKTSRSSYLQYASLRMVDRGVTAVGTPLFWGPTLEHLNIDHALVGVEILGANATLSWSRINYTTMAVHAVDGGSGGYPIIVANTITTVTSNPAIAILAMGLVQPTIQSNWITWVNGTDGANGGGIATAGQDGGPAVGILVTGGTWPIVAGNTVSQIRGGRGGAGGTPILPANGGRGGKGGDASGIVIANAQNSRAQTNDITAVLGGHGGNGGAANGLNTGGPGGPGGGAIAMEAIGSTTTGWWFYNDAVGITGGSAGDGGTGGVPGTGGPGGAAYAHFFLQNMAGNASNNLAQNLRGGYGGNGSSGGAGGDVGGVWMAGIGGSAVLGSNNVTGLVGGQGGAGGQTTAKGGDATALLVLGDAGYHNTTTIRGNSINGITGGIGGVGARGGSNGGAATALGVAYAPVVSSGNKIQAITGGQGGSTGPPFTNGQGGPATGLALALTPSSFSSLDRIQSVTPGLPGSGGNTPPPARAIGFYALGNATVTHVAALTNDTFASVGDYDLFLDNYTRTTSLNTTFAATKLHLGTASNLTVQNFLDVKVLWPNNVTTVWFSQIAVKDNGVEVYNRTSLFGYTRWIVLTNRVYIDSLVPQWNTTLVDVSYLSNSFQNDPRIVNMTASQTQYFTMIDQAPPTTSMGALPAYTASLAFTLGYTYSDGFGTGVVNITLWQRVDGGSWTSFAVIAATGLGFGFRSYTAPSDGTYEFAATAVDAAGNYQQPVPPSANQTWTVVDTTKPASRVASLPAWENSLSFPVSWGPDGGTTDIASYTVQYNRTGTWVAWLNATVLTSSTFTATSQGVYQFRALARDRAGNVETKVGNDTWTFVDTVAPASIVDPLPPYETATSFTVSWNPTGSTMDARDYTLQYSVDGTAWTTWFSGATNRSATFSGASGHRYAFRSLATDYAGNVESKTGNDTWTLVDTTPPASSVSPLPRYETALTFPLNWGPSGGTADASTFDIQVSPDGGSWTTWLTAVTNRSAVFAGADGHTYAFRSLATDRAGNVEAKAGNDTFTSVDATLPTILLQSPEGGGVDPGSRITVTFSEPMNRASVEQAFSLSPTIDGAVSWNVAGTVVTFTPARPLASGTTYTVFLATGAKDLAGNSLAAVRSFTFTTTGSSGPAGPAGFVLADWWPLFVAIAVGVIAAVVFLMRRRGSAAETVPAAAAPAPSAPATEIDDVFLLYRDGVLIKHETLRLRPDIDTDILSGMLTAVQQFVKDSFQGDEEGELNEITVGQMHLHLGKGKWLILAARVTGGDVTTMNDQIKRCIEDMEMHHWDQLEDWDGDMAISRVLGPYLKRLIRGEYAQP